MRRSVLTRWLLVLITIFFTQHALAAMVDGHAYKYGQSVHSDITIQLESLPGVPTRGFLGAVLLLAGLSLFWFRKRNRTVSTIGVVLAIAGLSCISYAFATYTTQTSSDGSYSLNNVDPGNYRLDASAPGYYPEYLVPVTIVDGTNAIQDITLYPMETPTPIPPTNTPVPTNTPTNTPTQTPTNTPTHTPTPNPPTNTPIPPTNTPVPPTNTPIPPTNTPIPPTNTPTHTPTQPPTRTPAPTPPNLYEVDPIVGYLIRVDAGAFMQGSPSSEPCRGGENQFHHTLTRNIAVMQTELTREMWAALKATQSSLIDDPSRLDISPTMYHPVQQVSWQEAILFANLLSLQRGLTRCYYTNSSFTTPITAANYEGGSYHCNFNANGFRLPFEGEWEYFARAGTTGPFSFTLSNYNSGNCSSCVAGVFPALGQHSVYCANSGNMASQVGLKLPNPWHFYDIHGNVYEWCWDKNGAYPTGSHTDYTGVTTTTNFRVIRGGYWLGEPRACRSAHRSMSTLGYHGRDIGVRFVRTIN